MLREICSANGIAFCAPKSSYFSFNNSPYIGHRNSSAVDIYPANGNWGCSVPSPIAGKVQIIKKIRMGKRRRFPTDEYDYAIGIQPSSKPSYLTRILHCKPHVEIGQEVDVLDIIGTTVRSRYFNFWTGPHYHVEMMKGENFRRSSKSIQLTIPHKKTVSSKSSDDFGQLEIVEVTEDRILAIGALNYTTLEDGLMGHMLTAEDSSIIGIIDAGIPHYVQGGYFGKQYSVKPGLLEWGNIQVGTRSSSSVDANRFIINSEIAFKLDSHVIRGISFYIYTKKNLINGSVPLVLIPKNYGGFVGEFESGDMAKLSESSNSS